MKVHAGQDFEIIPGYRARYDIDELDLVTLQIAVTTGDVWEFSATRDEFLSLVYEVRDALLLVAQEQFKIENNCARIERKDGGNGYQVILFPDGMPCNPVYWSADNSVAAIFEAQYQCRARIEELRAAGDACIRLDEWRDPNFSTHENLKL